MDNIGLKENDSSLKIDNITVIEMKALVNQRGVNGYYKLRKAELTHKLEADPDVNEQVLRISIRGWKYAETQQDQ